MHIDLHSLLIRPMGVGPTALNANGAAQKRLQPIVERGLEVQLGARQRELTYGPAGLFMSAAAAASREAAAALATDRDARTPVADPADEDDGADGAEGLAGDAGVVQRVAAPRDEAEAGGDAAADSGAQEDGEAAAAVARERAQESAGDDSEESAEESADAAPEDWALADPDGLASVPDTTGDGGVQDAVDSGEAVQFDDLADSQVNPFAPEEAAEGAAAGAPAMDETEVPVNWGDAYGVDAGTVETSAEAESVAEPVAEPVADEAAEIAEAAAEPAAGEVAGEVAGEAYGDAAGEGVPSTPPAWAAMADAWAQADAGEPAAPLLDLVA